VTANSTLTQLRPGAASTGRVEQAPDGVTARATEPEEHASTGAGRGVVPKWVRRIAVTLFGLQLAALIVFSTVQYRSFALSSDFGGHAQAWFAIAHGGLSPWSSVFRVPFWKNNAEFLFWPLALLYYVYPHSVDLLWAQDVAVVATELVVFAWLCELLEHHEFRSRRHLVPWVALACCLAMVADPWTYQTIAFDFHMEPFTALFTLLMARALWAGRRRQLWWWVPLTLLSAGLGGLAVCAVGVSGILAGRNSRRLGALLAVVGVGWVVALGVLGALAAGGQGLSAWYGYLTGHPGSASILGILAGLAHHPLAALHVAASRWYLVLGFLSVVGLVGVVWPWALPMAVVTIVPSAVNANASFLLPHAAFQTWPALPLVFVGSVVLLVRLVDAGPRGRRAARAFGAAWIGALAALAVIAIPEVPSYWLAVDGPAAAQLQRVHDQLPARAEVIASQGIVGRFSDRGAVYAFSALGERYPVTRRLVVFVFTPRQGVSPTPPRQTEEAMSLVSGRLGAATLLAKDGVYELEWRPPPGTTHVEVS
jgi:predicted membrane protein DUF2079